MIRRQRRFLRLCVGTPAAAALIAAAPCGAAPKFVHGLAEPVLASHLAGALPLAPERIRATGDSLALHCGGDQAWRAVLMVGHETGIVACLDRSQGLVVLLREEFVPTTLERNLEERGAVFPYTILIEPRDAGATEVTVATGLASKERPPAEGGKRDPADEFRELGITTWERETVQFIRSTKPARADSMLTRVRERDRGFRLRLLELIEGQASARGRWPWLNRGAAER